MKRYISNNIMFMLQLQACMQCMISFSSKNKEVRNLHMMNHQFICIGSSRCRHVQILQDQTQLNSMACDSTAFPYVLHVHHCSGFSYTSHISNMVGASLCPGTGPSLQSTLLCCKQDTLAFLKIRLLTKYTTNNNLSANS